MRRPADYRFRPQFVEHACVCERCATPLRWVERSAPARTGWFVDQDGVGVRFCPGYRQQLDQALRVGTGGLQPAC